MRKQHFRSFWGAWRMIAVYEPININRKGQAHGSALAARRGSFLVCLLRPAKFPTSTHAPASLQGCNKSVLTVLTHERLLLDFSVFTQDPLWPVLRAPTPNRAFQSTRLSCWLPRLRCVDARDLERLCGNRQGFLSNRRALDSSARASER